MVRRDVDEVCGSLHKGLAYFGFADAALFYGRATLVTQRNLSRAHCFLIVVGASGSGKSSVVRAGVEAALLKGEAVNGIHIATPTARTCKHWRRS